MTGSGDVHHRTEIGGLRALWRIDLQSGRIVVLAVHDHGGALPLAPGERLDLALARERWPRLTPLWDAVRHDFWSRLHMS
ncbi:hypothetical protein [Nocardia wallacei]|uniref:hypothetical protein n=1 Tax=Nocardia wallacei TaxID=480035 RepID=UPI00245903DF|nr:hypothetical protein [Nocardia wallacei]